MSTEARVNQVQLSRGKGSPKLGYMVQSGEFIPGGSTELSEARAKSRPRIEFFEGRACLIAHRAYLAQRLAQKNMSNK